MNGTVHFVRCIKIAYTIIWNIEHVDVSWFLISQVISFFLRDRKLSEEINWQFFFLCLSFRFLSYVNSIFAWVWYREVQLYRDSIRAPGVVASIRLSLRPHGPRSIRIACHSQFLERANRWSFQIKGRRNNSHFSNSLSRKNFLLRLSLSLDISDYFLRFLLFRSLGKLLEPAFSFLSRRPNSNPNNKFFRTIFIA